VEDLVDNTRDIRAFQPGQTPEDFRVHDPSSPNNDPSQYNRQLVLNKVYELRCSGSDPFHL
jgi:hypothetical protein